MRTFKVFLLTLSMYIWSKSLRPWHFLVMIKVQKPSKIQLCSCHKGNGIFLTFSTWKGQILWKLFLASVHSSKDNWLFKKLDSFSETLLISIQLMLEENCLIICLVFIVFVKYLILQQLLNPFFPF